DAFGQGDDLLLLQRDADHPRAVTSLQEEGAVSGLAHGAHHESLRRVEGVDEGHVVHLRTSPVDDPGPDPPPGWTSPDRSTDSSDGGFSHAREPWWVLTPSTSG